MGGSIGAGAGVRAARAAKRAYVFSLSEWPCDPAMRHSANGNISRWEFEELQQAVRLNGHEIKASLMRIATPVAGSSPSWRLSKTVSGKAGLVQSGSVPQHVVSIIAVKPKFDFSKITHKRVPSGIVLSL